MIQRLGCFLLPAVYMHEAPRLLLASSLTGARCLSSIAMGVRCASISRPPGDRPHRAQGLSCRQPPLGSVRVSVQKGIARPLFFSWRAVLNRREKYHPIKKEKTRHDQYGECAAPTALSSMLDHVCLLSGEHVSLSAKFTFSTLRACNSLCRAGGTPIAWVEFQNSLITHWSSLPRFSIEEPPRWARSWPIKIIFDLSFVVCYFCSSVSWFAAKYLIWTHISAEMFLYYYYFQILV